MPHATSKGLLARATFRTPWNILEIHSQFRRITTALYTWRDVKLVHVTKFNSRLIFSFVCFVFGIPRHQQDPLAFLVGFVRERGCQ